MLNTAHRDGVLIVELDHGTVNALDLELLQAITETFRAVAEDEAVVLTGAGRAFSAGVDLRRIVEGGPDYTSRFLEALSRCFLAVYDHPAPVVAAINGPAIAGGCVIAAACDRRLISCGPIGLAELAVGVPFPTSALEIMRGLVGPRVVDLALGARTMDVDVALAVGLVDEIAAAQTLLDRGIQRAAAWQTLPTGVFAHTKRQLHGPTRERIIARSSVDDAVTWKLWATPVVRKAIERYVSDLAQR